MMELLIGFLLGAVSWSMLYKSLMMGYKRGFKEYLGEITPEIRNEVDSMISGLHCDLENLANKTNTKAMKMLYNDVVELRGFILRRRMKN